MKARVVKLEMPGARAGDFLDRLFGRDLAATAWIVDPVGHGPVLAGVADLMDWAGFAPAEPANDLFDADDDMAEDEDEDHEDATAEDLMGEAFDEDMFWAVMASRRRR